MRRYENKIKGERRIGRDSKGVIKENNPSSNKIRERNQKKKMKCATTKQEKEESNTKKNK